MQDNHKARTLTRGNTGLVAGVCSGLADYYGLRKNGLRIAFLITSFFFGIAVLAYIVLWLILPKYPTSQALARQLRRNAEQRRSVGS